MEASKKAGQTVGVRLVGNGMSDVPVMANFARVHLSAPAVVVDFGFVEPAALQALASVARNGGKVPEAMDGRLAARVAMTPDAMIALHQQLGQAIAGLKEQVGQVIAAAKEPRKAKEAQEEAAPVV